VLVFEEENGSPFVGALRVEAVATPRRAVE
jgi:hypothetical protein